MNKNKLFIIDNNMWARRLNCEQFALYCFQSNASDDFVQCCRDQFAETDIVRTIAQYCGYHNIEKRPRLDLVKWLISLPQLHELFVNLKSEIQAITIEVVGPTTIEVLEFLVLTCKIVFSVLQFQFVFCSFCLKGKHLQWLWNYLQSVNRIPSRKCMIDCLYLACARNRIQTAKWFL